MEDESTQAKKAMRHNERMFHKVMKKISSNKSYIPPMEDHELTHEKKEQFLPLIARTTPLNRLW